MRTRIVWLLIGVGLTVMVSQAWAKTLAPGKAADKATSFTKRSRELKVTVTNKPSPRCLRGLAPGDPEYGKSNQDPAKRSAVGTDVHRFDCKVRVSCCSVSGASGAEVPEGSKYVRIPVGDLADTTDKYVVVTMKHKKNIVGQVSYPVSVRKSNCPQQDRCIY